MGNLDGEHHIVNMQKYREGILVAEQYQITAPMQPVFGANSYQASKHGKSYLLIQLYPWVSFPKNSSGDFSFTRLENCATPTLVTSLEGRKLFKHRTMHVDANSRHDFYYKLLQWLGDYHARHQKRFPYLNFANTYVDENDEIKIWGANFEYKYQQAGSETTIFDDGIAPSYRESLMDPERVHSDEIDDYYAIAVMLWESIIAGKPDVSIPLSVDRDKLGRYGPFITHLLDPRQRGSLKVDNIMELFDREYTPKKVAMPTTPNTQTPAKPVSVALKPISPAKIEAPKVAEEYQLMRDEITRLHQLNSDLNDQLVELQERESYLESDFARETRILKGTVVIFIVVALATVGTLYLMGFRLLSAAKLAQHRQIQIQKHFWHALLYLQNSQPQRVRQVLQDAVDAGQTKLIYKYLLALSNMQILKVVKHKQKRRQLKQQALDYLRQIRKNSQQFHNELQLYKLPITNIKKIEMLIKNLDNL